MTLKKEFGKLTEAQFKELIDYIPQVLNIAEQEAPDFFRGLSLEQQEQLFSESLNWSWLYEFPFRLHLAIAMEGFSWTDALHDLATQADPQAAALEFIKQDDVPDPTASPQAVLALWASVMRAMQSATIHGRTLNALVGDVQQDENSDSLFKAIRIDRTVVHCPTIAARILKAELVGDIAFFEALGKAVAQGISGKEWRGLAKMKYSFMTLMDMDVHHLSGAQLEELMVHTLDAYQNVPGARKNLREQYLKFRKFPTI